MRLVIGLGCIIPSRYAKHFIAWHILICSPFCLVLCREVVQVLATLLMIRQQKGHLRSDVQPLGICAMGERQILFVRLFLGLLLRRFTDIAGRQIISWITRKILV